jgi:hypothetical protein
MATHQALRAKAQPAAKAMCADGLLGVMGARRHVAAAALRAEHELERKENHAVGADKEDGNRLHEPPSMAKFQKNATRERATFA